MKIHQKVWSESRGEIIPENWHIHHLDGNHNNNHPDNLICVSPEMHWEIHAALFRRYGRMRDFAAMQYLVKDRRLMDDYQCPPNPNATEAMKRANTKQWEVISNEGKVFKASNQKEANVLSGMSLNSLKKYANKGVIARNPSPRTNKIFGDKWVGWTVNKLNKN